MPEEAVNKPVAAAGVESPSSPIAPVAAAPTLSYIQKVFIAVALSLAAILLIGFIFYVIQILVLCFAGVLLAVFLSAPADLLAARAKIRRGYALGIVMLSLVLLVLGGGYFMGYTVYRESQELTRTLPEALRLFEADLHNLFPAKTYEAPATNAATMNATMHDASQPSLPTSPTITTSTSTSTSAPATGPFESTPGDWLADKIIQVRQAATDFFLSETFMKSAGGVVSSTFGLIVNIVVILCVGLYFAISPGLYARGLVLLFPISRRPRVDQILTQVGSQLQWWFVGQLCSMTCTTILTFTGLKIIGVPMAVPLAILAGLLNFVPNFGPIIAAVPAVLVAFAPHGDRTQLSFAMAGWTILVYLIIQSLDGWIITPYFQQRAVALPPALIVISQVVFALLLGPVGLILATPILATTIVLVKTIYVEDVLGDRGGGKIIKSKPG